jgi:hypothetical protein
MEEEEGEEEGEEGERKPRVGLRGEETLRSMAASGIPHTAF